MKKKKKEEEKKKKRKKNHGQEGFTKAFGFIGLGWTSIWFWPFTKS